MSETPEPSTRRLRVVSGDENSLEELSATERRFALEYFGGEYAGNGVQCYRLIHPDATYESASVLASNLLKLDKVKQFLRDLREKAVQATMARLAPWQELAVECQAIVMATARGELRSRIAFDAAKHVLDRAYGLPVATSEIRVMDHARMAELAARFTKRIQDETERRSKGLEVKGQPTLPENHGQSVRGQLADGRGP